MTDTTDKITSWPPNIDEWQSSSDQTLRLTSCPAMVWRDDDGYMLLCAAIGSSYAYIWNGHRMAPTERIDGTTGKDAAIAGFNRLIELGIIKRRPVSPVDSSVDCDGPVDDSPIFVDNLE